jgi:hypothetical protein
MTTPSNSNPQELFTPFLSTTFNIPEAERLPSFLNEQLANISDVVNQKKIGVYGPYENFNGELWYYKTTNIERNGYQAILYLPSLVSSTYTLPIESVDPNFVVTHVWGSASKPCSATGAGDGDYFSFYSQGNASVTFTMNDKNIVVTAAGLSAYSVFFVIEYLRAGT